MMAQLTLKYLSGLSSNSGEGISTVRYSVVVQRVTSRACVSGLWRTRGVVGLTSEQHRPAPCWTAPGALESECNYRRQRATEERTTEWTMHIGGLLYTRAADTIRLRMQYGNGGRELTADLAYTLKIRGMSW